MENLFTDVEKFFSVTNPNVMEILNNIELGNISKELYESINTQDIYGNTYLHYALGYEKIKSILFLIKLNVKINILNNNKLCILHILFIKCIKFMKNCDKKAIAYLELSKHLISKGADMNLKNIYIPSPLEIINKYINYQDHHGNTISHFLIKYGKINTVYYLINVMNVNLNLQNNNGETLLHYAILSSIANYDNIEIFNFILFLLKNGAYEYIKDKNGNYPGDFYFNLLKKKDIKKN